MSIDLPITAHERILYKWNLDTNDLEEGRPSDGKHPKINDKKAKNKDKRKLADPVPFGLKVFKGRKSWQLPLSFVNFVLHHPVAKAFEGKSVF